MNSHGLYGYTTPPPNGHCWVDQRELPEERRGYIPALCGPACDAQWIATHSLDGAVTHVVTDTGWQPVTAPALDQVVVEVTGPATEQQMVERAPVPKPGSWLHRLRRAV